MGLVLRCSLLQAGHGQQTNVVDQGPDASTGPRRRRFAQGEPVQAARAENNDRPLGPDRCSRGRKGRVDAVPGKNGCLVDVVESCPASANGKACLVVLSGCRPDVLVDEIKNAAACRSVVKLQKVDAINGGYATSARAPNLELFTVLGDPAGDLGRKENRLLSCRDLWGFKRPVEE
jgi:hypothetical protein